MNETALRYRNIIEQLNDLDGQGRSDEALHRARDAAREARGEGEEGYALFFEGEEACLSGELRRGARLEGRAAELLPDVPFVLSNFGVLLSMLGRPRRALGVLDRALNIEPRDLHALAQKGVCLSKMGFDQEALRCFERILELEPGQPHALRNRAISLSRIGREAEALTILDQVLALDSLDSHARSERKILLDEIHLRGTPLGWLLLWVRKSLFPALRRAWYRAF